jgi:hypothetical protein
MLHRGTATLDYYKCPQHDRRHNDVETKETSNSIREKLFDEQAKIKAVLPKEGNKLRVRHNRTQDAKQQVQTLRFHLLSSVGVCAAGPL